MVVRYCNMRNRLRIPEFGERLGQAAEQIKSLATAQARTDERIRTAIDHNGAETEAQIEEESRKEKGSQIGCRLQEGARLSVKLALTADFT